jgi:hypothetical protein
MGRRRPRRQLFTRADAVDGETPSSHLYPGAYRLIRSCVYVSSCVQILP